MECGEVEEFVDEEIERRQKQIAPRKGLHLRITVWLYMVLVINSIVRTNQKNKYYYAKKLNTLEERVLELISLNESLRKVNRDLVSQLNKKLDECEMLKKKLICLKHL